MQRSNARWEDFLAFLDYRATSPQVVGNPSEELEAELRAAGLDVDRVSAKVGETARLWRGRDTASWIRRGRAAQAAFERAVREKKEWVSRRFQTAGELWAAISSGELGPRVQRHATVFFRNQDASRLSDRDLRSFLDDCELLGLLDEEEKSI
jgi:hypothetical protein